MRFLKKNLPALTMLAAGFACGVVVTLIFASGRNPTVLRPAASSLALGPRLDCSSQLSDCVCDKEAEKLRRLARLAFLRSQVAVNVTHVRQTVPGLTKENISELKTFLYPSNPDVYPGIPLGVPKLLKEEYLIKEPMVIGILTQQEYLHTRAQGVYETWAQDITEGKVVFFVGEDCEISANLSHLPIIKLIGIPDNVYPPLKKAFAVMQYMYDHFINDFNWFIRADDDMYVRGELLTELLKKMSPYERVYLGRAGVGKDGDLDRLHLLPHERYCMGGPGVVFSNAAMRAIGPHLNDCLNAVFLHDQKSSQKWNDDDVEIGRCISRKLDFQCSTSAESRLKFHTDYSGDSLRPLSLWSKPVFRDIVSMHPVKDPRNMHAIHHFYKTIEFEQRYEELFDLMSYTNSLCRNLPNHLVPPAFLSIGCHLQIASQGSEEGGRNRGGSFLVNRSTSVLANPTDIHSDETHWEFFNRDSLFDIGGISPRFPLRLSLQAELKHVETLLHKYLLRSPDCRDFVLDEVLHGYVRFLPATGREFRLRVKLSHTSEKKQIKYLSVRLLRQLSQEIAISVEPTGQRPIHVILPLLMVDDRFREFLKNFVQQGLEKGVTLSLVVVLFSEMNANLVEGIVKQLTRGFPKAMVTIAISEGQYSFPRGVEMGMSVLSSHDDVAFVTDVNARVRSDFWSRCRDNTRSGKQVYFPTPFSVYVSDFRMSLVNTTSSYPINRWTGQWTFYSPKTFCVIKRDYLGVGGFKDAAFSHDFFQRLLGSGDLEVFQGPDPGLYQLWPTGRTCNSLNSVPKRRACEEMTRSHAHFPPADLAEYLVALDGSKGTKL